MMFDFRNSNITKLNKTFFDGDLDLSFSEILCLPENINVTGNLYLQYTKIRSLPMLKVGGHIDLFGSMVENLAVGFFCFGNLYLQQSKIETLPDHLMVLGDLWMSKNIEIPSNATIIGGVIIDTMPIDTHSRLIAGDF